jgi:uncharacterized protein YdhG (YjbR/CyaY superfamily)
MKNPEDFDDYLSGRPLRVQQKLKQLRAIVMNAAPGAEAVISYGMPAYKMHGILVYFAAHSHHIGFYPKASGIRAFQKDLSSYTWAKGSVQFPLDKPLPVRLITRIVKFRVAENAGKVRAKKKKM